MMPGKSVPKKEKGKATTLNLNNLNLIYRYKRKKNLKENDQQA